MPVPAHLDHVTTRSPAFAPRGLDRLVDPDTAYREGVAEGREDAFQAVLDASEAMHSQDAAARRLMAAVVRRAQTGSVIA